MKKYDITGNTYGYLTVVCRHGLDNTRRNSTWLCNCKCGNTAIVSRSSLVTGHTISCGCRQYESKNYTHNMSKTRIYHEWLSMRRRCDKKYGKDSKDYFQRGITVCDEWKNDFIAFRDWAFANGYSDSLTIDRIDNDRGYSPENCRWISIADQQSNKRNNVFFDYKGGKKCLRQICIEEGFSYHLAHQRYRKMLNSGRAPELSIILSPKYSRLK